MSCIAWSVLHFHKPVENALQVHTMIGGNHSLHATGGKHKAEEALQAALTAACTFLASLDSVMPPRRESASGTGEKNRGSTGGKQKESGAGKAEVNPSQLMKSGKRKRASVMEEPEVPSG